MSDPRKNKISQGIGLLKQWLTMQGVNDYAELDEQEKAAYSEWEAVLTKEATIPELVAHLSKKEIPLLRKEMTTAVLEGKTRRAIYIAARIQNYETMVAILDQPERARDALIADIKNLIATNGNN